MVPPPLTGAPIKFVGVLEEGVTTKAKLMKLNFDKFGIKHTIGLGLVLKPVLILELVEIAVQRIR